MPRTVAELRGGDELPRLHVGRARAEPRRSEEVDRKGGRSRTGQCGLPRQPGLGALQTASAERGTGPLAANPTLAQATFHLAPEARRLRPAPGSFACGRK